MTLSTVCKTHLGMLHFLNFRSIYCNVLYRVFCSIKRWRSRCTAFIAVIEECMCVSKWLCLVCVCSFKIFCELSSQSHRLKIANWNEPPYPNISCKKIHAHTYSPVICMKSTIRIAHYDLRGEMKCVSFIFSAFNA